MVAVTGANGLLGSFIIDKLLKGNIQTIAIARKTGSSNHALLQRREADILDSVTLAEALEGATCVIHAAALVSFNPNSAKQIFETNVTGTKNIVDACLQKNITRLIHVSSVGALGKPKGVKVITEDSKWIESTTNTDYAESKYLAELEVFRGYEEGLFTSVVNPSVILCPGDWERSSAKLFKFVWDEKPFYTDGQFNYIDVRDLVDLIFRLYQSSPEKINGQKFIANAGSVQFQNFFQQVAKRFGKRAPFIKVNPALIGIASFLESIRCRITGAEPLIVSKTIKANQHAFVYDNKKAIEELKMQFHTLEETLDWCCEKYMADNTINN